MPSTDLSGLLVQPLAQRIKDWCAAGKLDEEDLDRSLSEEARAWVEHSIAEADWAPLRDVEGLVSIAAAQLGGETGLVEWAPDLVDGWRGDDSIESILSNARTLVDGSGFVVSQLGERLVRRIDWQYEGGRTGFQVRLRGLEAMSPALKALIGASLARLADAADARDVDARFEGVDDEELVIFGACDAELAEDATNRLHRAALVG